MLKYKLLQVRPPNEDGLPGLCGKPEHQGQLAGMITSSWISHHVLRGFFSLWEIDLNF